MTATDTKRSEKDMLHSAFREMRKAGVNAILGVGGCCRGCIWAEHAEEWSEKPTIWFYKGQGNQLKYDLDDNVESHNVLYLNHNSAKFPEEIIGCIGVLQRNGLVVDWDGSDGSCIKVVLP